MLHALVNFKVGKVEIEKKKKNLWRSLTSQPRLLSKVYVNQRLCLKKNQSWSPYPSTHIDICICTCMSMHLYRSYLYSMHEYDGYLCTYIGYFSPSLCMFIWQLVV